jgi:hypothetical protein
MIVDCHTHLPAGGSHAGAPPEPAEFVRAVAPADAALVLGCAGGSGAATTGDRLGDFVAAEPGRLFGLAAIDPTDPSALTEIDRAVDFGLSGLVIAPAALGVHPADTRAMDVYQRAGELHLPVIFELGGRPDAQWRLEYARPYLLDEPARTFPELRIVVSHLGRPWVDETAVLLDKHPHVYADICGLAGRPWQAYQALSLCSAVGVMHKLLFGSDHPHSSAAEAIKALYTVNELTRGTNLPPVPLRELRGIVERDALFLLGLTDRASETVTAVPSPPPLIAGAAGEYQGDSGDEGEPVTM